MGTIKYHAPPKEGNNIFEESCPAKRIERLYALETCSDQ